MDNRIGYDAEKLRDMDFWLQLWGGAFYLLNKILFSVAETKSADAKRYLKIVGWGIYILGVPPWVIILVSKHNWIAASIEAGGLPAMIFGLYAVIKGGKINPFFDKLTSIITYLFVVLGLGLSFYQYGGIATITQVFELGVMVGFLLGGYLLAKEHISGWLCFALMNISMGSLMLIQHKPILAVQQGASLCFVIFGLIALARNRRLQARACS